MRPGEPSEFDESTTGRHIPALDGLRGLAVFLVLLRHLFVRNPLPEGSLIVRSLTRLMASGWMGVDLFFVLSGFLITGILYDTRKTPHYFRNFYARRALRVFPLYYGVLTLLIVVSSLQGYHWYRSGTLLYLTYFHTLLIHGVAYTNAPWVNINHLWSLAIEEQFYLVWPCAVFFLLSRKPIASTAIGVALASLALRIWLVFSGVTQTYPYSTYAWTPGRLDGLLLGAAAAMLVRSGRREQAVRWAPWIFAGALGVTLLSIFSTQEYSPTTGRFVPTIGLFVLAILFASLIVACLAPLSAFARIFSLKWLCALGRYSYGLYVLHWPLHAIFDERLHAWFFDRTHSKMLSVLGPGVLLSLLSLAAAMASFHLFEAPILKWKRYFPSHGGAPRLRHQVAAAAPTVEGERH